MALIRPLLMAVGLVLILLATLLLLLLPGILLLGTLLLMGRSLLRRATLGPMATSRTCWPMLAVRASRRMATRLLATTRRLALKGTRATRRAVSPRVSPRPTRSKSRTARATPLNLTSL